MQQMFQNSASFNSSTLRAYKLSFTWPNEAQDGSLVNKIMKNIYELV